MAVRRTIAEPIAPQRACNPAATVARSSGQLRACRAEGEASTRNAIPATGTADEPARAEPTEHHHLFLAGGGEMGARMRAHDWAATPLGAPGTWPDALRTMVSTVINSALLGAVLWGPELRLLYNDAYAPALGERHPDALGRPLPEVWADIWHLLAPSFLRVLQTGVPHFESRLPLPMTRGGQRLTTYWNYSVAPIRDGTGAIVGLLNQALDATAEVQAANALRQSEQRHRDLLQQMPGFVGVMTGPDHVYEYVNDAFVAISGPRQFVGRSIRDVFPEVEGQGFFELLDQVYATGEPYAARSVPFRLAGEVRDRFVDLVYQPIRADDGGITGIFVGGYEVTEQNRAATALHELNADLERKVTERAMARGRTWQVSPDLLVVISADGFFEAFNPAWTALLGWSEEELTRTVFSAFVHPDDQAATQAVWLDAVERNLPALRFENRYRHRDGTWRWLSWVGVPDDGKVYCSARDITADKEQASALAQAEDALRQSQKMEAVGQLTGGVAHDFNNLLTVIRSSTDLLKRPALSEERRARYVNAISDTVDRAARLTGQLLAFARRQALKPEVFDATDSVRGLTDMMRTLTGSRVQITARLPDTPCFVNADASQFDTALVNLAVNARDAMDGEGRIVIGVFAVEAVPAIRAHPLVEGAYVAISLSDTGSGIPASLVERIFEPFFTTKEVGKGTGLGLSQVFGFAKQSGGDVNVASTVGAGTTFTLFLPRVAAPAGVEAADEAAALVDGHGTRVLVVEDNINVGTFAVQTLSDLGYAPTLAADGAAALDELAKGADRFDVVFSDVMMPGMTGIELGQEIRRLYHDLPVVLTSGYSHVLAQNGTYGFELLHKPYSVEQLSQILRKAASWQRRKRLLVL